MTCPLNKQKPYFIYPSNYRNSQSTTSVPICTHTEAHAIIVFKHYFTAWKSLMWGPCNKFHNCCQNCTETRVSKRLLICLCQNVAVLQQLQQCVALTCSLPLHRVHQLQAASVSVAHTHTPPLCCRFVNSCFLGLRLCCRCLSCCCCCFCGGVIVFIFSFVLNMFSRFPIAPGFNPICFAQSPPLLTYIAGPKAKAPHFPIEFSTSGSLHNFNFLSVIGQSNWPIAKKRKKVDL